MENPWKALRNEPPFVLDCDEEAIKKLNKKYDDKHPKFIHTELPPEPFSGNKDAPLVLFSFHPGFNRNDHLFMVEDKNFYESMRKTRLHESQEYPFYHLNDDVAYRENPGLDYWSKRFVKHVSNGTKDNIYYKCANSIFLLQYFPYKLKTYDSSRQYNESPHKILPWQRYAFYLLQEAMHRDATIVVMCYREKWNTAVRTWADSKQAINELNGYKNIFYCRNYRRPTISNGNIEDAEGYLIDFNKIMKLIR